MQLAFRPVVPRFAMKASGLQIVTSGKLFIDFVPRLENSNRYNYQSKKYMDLTLEEVGHLMASINGGNTDGHCCKIVRYEEHATHLRTFDSSEVSDGFLGPHRRDSRYDGIIEKGLKDSEKELSINCFVSVKLEKNCGASFEYRQNGQFMDTDVVMSATINAGELEVIKAVLQNTVGVFNMWRAGPALNEIRSNSGASVPF